MRHTNAILAQLLKVTKPDKLRFAEEQPVTTYLLIYEYMTIRVISAMDQRVTKALRFYEQRVPFYFKAYLIVILVNFNALNLESNALLVKTYTLLDPEKATRYKLTNSQANALKVAKIHLNALVLKNKRVAFGRSLTNQRRAFGHFGKA